MRCTSALSRASAASIRASDSACVSLANAERGGSVSPTYGEPDASAAAAAEYGVADCDDCGDRGRFDGFAVDHAADSDDAPG